MSKTNGPAPIARRINRGRGHSYELDGQRVPGVTTVLGALPKPGLIKWAGEETAKYAVDRWDELTTLPPTERLARLIGAREETRRAAAARGTIVHGYAQRLAAGEAVDVPDEYGLHVDAYLDFDRDWQPTELLVERPVFSRKHRYAGTPDLVAELADGRIWLLDWKTSEKGVFPEAALQLAAARFADFLLDESEQPVPVASLGIEATGVVNLRADGYDLHPVEADEQAFAVFLHLLALHNDFLEQPRDSWVADRLPPMGAHA